MASRLAARIHHQIHRDMIATWSNGVSNGVSNGWREQTPGCKYCQQSTMHRDFPTSKLVVEIDERAGAVVEDILGYGRLARLRHEEAARLNNR
jgi:hypothetical protein